MFGVKVLILTSFLFMAVGSCVLLFGDPFRGLGLMLLSTWLLGGVLPASMWVKHGPKGGG